MSKHIPKLVETFGQTANVKSFIAANDKAPVVSGAGYKGGGGHYTLVDGQTFKLTLNEARSLPPEYPKWVHSEAV